MQQGYLMPCPLWGFLVVSQIGSMELLKNQDVMVGQDPAFVSMNPAQALQEASSSRYIGVAQLYDKDGVRERSDLGYLFLLEVTPDNQYRLYHVGGFLEQDKSIAPVRSSQDATIWAAEIAQDFRMMRDALTVDVNAMPEIPRVFFDFEYVSEVFQEPDGEYTYRVGDELRLVNQGRVTPADVAAQAELWGRAAQAFAVGEFAPAHEPHQQVDLMPDMGDWMAKWAALQVMLYGGLGVLAAGGAALSANARSRRRDKAERNPKPQ